MGVCAVLAMMGPGLVLAVDDIGSLPGQPITLNEIEAVIRIIVTFLIRISVVIAVGAIVVAGILYMTAGDSGRVEKAKALLWSGVIGAAIVFGVGVILKTVGAIVGRVLFFS